MTATATRSATEAWCAESTIARTLSSTKKMIAARTLVRWGQDRKKRETRKCKIIWITISRMESWNAKNFNIYTITIIAALTLARWGWQTQSDSRRQRKATTDKTNNIIISKHHIYQVFPGWDKHHNFSSHQAGMSCCSEEFPCNTSCGGHNAQSCAACPQVIWLSSVLQILSFDLDLMLILKFLGLCLMKAHSSFHFRIMVPGGAMATVVGGTRNVSHLLIFQVYRMVFNISIWWTTF